MEPPQQYRFQIFKNIIMQNYNVFKGVILFLIVLLLNSCGAYFHQPLHPKPATLGHETQAKKDLLLLPNPQEKIVAAVYKFRDQTGQYKPSSTGASWSTAVTQGATTILIRALEESGWFIPIERENMSNLLNERKIIRSSRQQYEGNNNANLPPLLFAGVILEGGIISYETNVMTGGAGLRYFGSGASSQYREDRVTIYLRAVSTSNGKILKTVYTTKSILSQEVDIGVFRYVKFKRLLEAETGFTYNEPTELAVTEAIEKAVEALIIEGVQGNLWALENPLDSISNSFVEYKEDKIASLNTDHIGRKFIQQKKRGVFGIGIEGGAQFYDGDYETGDMKPVGSFSLSKSVGDYFSLELENSIGFLNSTNVFNSRETVSLLNLAYTFVPYQNFSPYSYVGIGAIHDWGTPVGLSKKDYIPLVGMGGGVEYMFSRHFGINGEAYFNYMLNDHYDYSINGKYNDAIYGLKIGLKYYFK